MLRFCGELSPIRITIRFCVQVKCSDYTHTRGPIKFLARFYGDEEVPHLLVRTLTRRDSGQERGTRSLVRVLTRRDSDQERGTRSLVRECVHPLSHEAPESHDEDDREFFRTRESTVFRRKTHMRRQRVKDGVHPGDAEFEVHITPGVNGFHQGVSHGPVIPHERKGSQHVESAPPVPPQG